MVAALTAGMFRDARYSIRLLLRSPLVATVAILSLALGIGGAASVFTVLNADRLARAPGAEPTAAVFSREASRK